MLPSGLQLFFLSILVAWRCVALYAPIFQMCFFLRFCCDLIQLFSFNKRMPDPSVAYGGTTFCARAARGGAGDITAAATYLDPTNSVRALAAILWRTYAGARGAQALYTAAKTCLSFDAYRC